MDDVSLRACYRPVTITNGDFEEGLSGWEKGGVLPVGVVTDTVRTGRKAVLLGTPSNLTPVSIGSGWITQRIFVPKTTSIPVLHYAYRVLANDVLERSRLAVMLVDGDGVPHVLRLMGYAGQTPPTAVYDSQWQDVYDDLAPYRGQWVQVFFLLENRYSYSNGGAAAPLGAWAYIDEVSIEDGAVKGAEKQRLPFLVSGYRWEDTRQGWRQPSSPVLERKR